MFFLKNSKFPTALFIIASLIVFLVVASFYFIFKFNFLIADFNKEISEKNNYSQKKDYQKNDFKDPYITFKPSLKTLIKGPIINLKDPFLGNKDAKVFLVVFSDFSCTFCKKEENILRDILDTYKDKLILIRKDYPLNDINTESFRAARAARCAQMEGNFWDFHDLLFKYPEKRSREDFIDFALNLGFDKNSFQNCLQKKEVDKEIKNNIDEADALGVYGIPFIYVNKHQFIGELGREELKKIIEKELNIK